MVETTFETMILILGGTGILGSEILKILKIQNLDFSSPSSEELDITDPKKIFSVVSALRPNWIINCAAFTNVELAESKIDDAIELNCNSVRNLALVAKQFGSKLIHISTDYVFDGRSKTPYLESDLPNPINWYGKTKFKGELEVLRHFPEKSSIIRTSWLYGVQGNNFVKTVAKKGMAKEKINVVVDQIGSPTNAMDLARGIFSMLKQHAEFGIFHYSNRGTISWYEFAQEIYRLMGLDLSLVKPIYTESLRLHAARPSFSVLNTEKWEIKGLESIPDWKSSLNSTIPDIITNLEEQRI